jgi:dihydrofolate reductase
MTISILAIVASNGTIGRDNALPWHMATDLKRFKALTMGHHMIMGRKTFESLGGRILPGRPHIVVTRQELNIDGIQVAHSIDEALALAAGDPEPFIVGGAEIYRQSLHRATRMYITQIHADVDGDTTFPEFDDVNEWKLVDREDFEADEKNDYPFSFLTYEKAIPNGASMM